MKRAVLWSGAVEPWEHPRPGQRHDRGIQLRDLQRAYRGARALGVGPRDIHAFLVDEDLAPDDLPASQLYPATIAALEKLLSSLTGMDDELLFIAVNHSTNRGMATAWVAEEDGEEFVQDSHLLTPATLSRLLDPLGGNQILILSVCYAGIFTSLGREGRMVMTSCGVESYRVQTWDGENAVCPFLEATLRAWCGYDEKEDFFAAPARQPIALASVPDRAKDFLTTFKFIPGIAGSANWTDP